MNLIIEKQMEIESMYSPDKAYKAIIITSQVMNCFTDNLNIILVRNERF